MSELTNPLFEDEKDFLERKKLEYERALRGDVEQLKEQGAQVGKVALIGAGAVAGIWLLSKAFGGRKRRRAAEREEWDNEDDYNGYDDPDYRSQYFADLDDDDERWTGPSDDYFGGSDHGHQADHGSVYHTDTDRYDDPSGPAGPTSFADDEAGSTGFGDYPAADYNENDERPGFVPDLSYDDSRRLPDGDDFEAGGEAAAPRRSLGATLLAFAKSDLGKAVIGQALSIGAALAAKAFADKFAEAEVDTTDSSDLAAPSWPSDGYAHGHPAQPQPAAPDAPAAPADTYAPPREPLA